MARTRSTTSWVRDEEGHLVTALVIRMVDPQTCCYRLDARRYFYVEDGEIVTR